MNQSNKVHSQLGNVPFSWENEPGVSKTTNRLGCPNERHRPLKLPPPPCLTESARVSVHDIQIPLPPCTFQQRPPPSRSSSRKGSSRTELEDPFLVALKECTKSSTTAGKGKLSAAGLKKKGLFNFYSCKHSCSVNVDDNLVKISQLPYKKNDEG
ncbi:hypothetical protein ACOSP7_010477 [Xanthoceras sorbifolium]